MSYQFSAGAIARITVTRTLHSEVARPAISRTVVSDYGFIYTFPITRALLSIMGAFLFLYCTPPAPPPPSGTLRLTQEER